MKRLEEIREQRARQYRGRVMATALTDIDYLISEVERLEQTLSQVRAAILQTTDYPIEWPDGIAEVLDDLLGIWNVRSES